MKVTLADTSFLPHTKSAFIGGDNIGVGPTHFEWEPEEPTHARFVTDSWLIQAKGPGQVGWLIEPYSLHPENYLVAANKDFDAVLTHNRYMAAAFAHRHWYWYPHGGSLVDFSEQRVHDKKKGISLLLSSKRSMVGHEMRHLILRTAGRRITAVFGIDEPVRAIEAYRDFRYSIVVENERAPGYFTERLIDCLSVGTVPIYWGDPDIGSIFDIRGILVFTDIYNLGVCLANANFDDYRHRAEAIAKNVILCRPYRICEDRIFALHPELFGGN